MMTKDGQSIELVQYDAPADRKTYRPRYADVGSWHIALKVTDLDDIVRASSEWGWQVNGEVAVVEEELGSVGARVVYLHNADSTTLELPRLLAIEQTSQRRRGCGL